ncbi:hypothetical protein JTE90_005723 [Oedothorax gibbosus]|uniref:Uncharacterized protein n=1 Tax=Oedothorax gibbosus TaxID=931172 RepID=A0AAV6ULL7_9ARAC|nr:hypothetical protein JTE90_005723 [Oedothorax gibbosus]
MTTINLIHSNSDDCCKNTFLRAIKPNCRRSQCLPKLRSGQLNARLGAPTGAFDLQKKIAVIGICPETQLVGQQCQKSMGDEIKQCHY